MKGLYLIVPFAPLVGAIIAGLGGRRIGMNPQCIKCGGHRTLSGKVLDSDGSACAWFQPSQAGTWAKFLGRGVRLPSKTSWACLDCGVIWTQADAMALNRFVERHSRQS